MRAVLESVGVTDVLAKSKGCLLYTSYRIRKRSNHVTLFVGSKSNNEDQN